MDIQDKYQENKYEPMDLEEPQKNIIKHEALEENEMEEEDPKDDEILKRNEIKNQRTNYTINEKLKILKEQVHQQDGSKIEMHQKLLQY